MYLTVIAWMYVVLMMSVAEAASPSGTLLGAITTFLLYGLLPLGIVVYIMGTPGRRRARKAREAEEAASLQAGAEPSDSGQPDAGSQASAGVAGAGTAATADAAVRKEP